MKSNRRYVVAAISLVSGLVLTDALLNVSARQRELEAFSQSELCRDQTRGERFAKTELFFGLSKSDDSQVTNEEFQTFLNQVVTPLFPDGMTLLSGKGQFRDSKGKVTTERSHLLILLYPFSPESNGKIEQIREAYKRTFQQESVLRLDERSCVSF
jgi:Protein of unknown function (DUF3574)